VADLTPSIVIPDLRDGYVDLVNWVISEGTPVSPRGQATHELLGARVVLTNPLDAFPLGVGRNLNTLIGVAEAAQSFSGVSDAEMLNSVSSGAFRMFMNGNVLRGAYGPRVAPQMPGIAARLFEDPDSRQTVALVWKPDDLWRADTKDLPCTVSLQFAIRDGKLHCFTSMRSNDVWLGVAYDFFMFTRIQITLAWALGVEVGNYYHSATSLHIYDRNLEAAAELVKAGQSFADVQVPLGFTNDNATAPAPESADAVSQRVLLAQDWAAMAILGMRDDPMNPPIGNRASEYVDLLEPHITIGGVYCPICSYVRPTSESVAAMSERRGGLTGVCSRCAVTPGSGNVK
jgi:thymidylate synthase